MFKFLIFIIFIFLFQSKAISSIITYKEILDNPTNLNMSNFDSLIFSANKYKLKNDYYSVLNLIK